MFEHTGDRVVPRRFALLAAGTIMLILGVGVTGAQPCEEVVWLELSPAVSPSPGAGVMAYDSARGVVVLVSRGDSETNSTWEWNGENWSPGPSGEGVPWGTMTFDSVRGRTILAGGGTWSWDGDTWTRVSEFSPPIDYALMTFDSDRGVAVLYAGGLDRTTWEWNGSDWTLVSTLGLEFSDLFDGPPAWFGASICYDSNVHRTILHGGWNQSVRNETWAWDGIEWTFIDFGPGDGYDASMTFDAARNRRVLFGGWIVGPGGYLRLLGDTWESAEGMEWTLVDSTGPRARAMAGMTYDGARNNIVLFGGSRIGEAALGDTWIRTQRQVNGGPSILTQPMDAQVVVGNEASFHVEAGGEGTITYQWRKDGVPLTDTRRVLGARTSVLRILDAAASDEGTYDVVVTNPCESVTSDAATLDVVGVCPADFNADAIVNSQDFFDFLTAFFASLPAADFDASGAVDSGDFFAFLDAFFGECV